MLDWAVISEQWYDPLAGILPAHSTIESGGPVIFGLAIKERFRAPGRGDPCKTVVEEQLSKACASCSRANIELIDLRAFNHA